MALSPLHKGPGGSSDGGVHSHPLQRDMDQGVVLTGLSGAHTHWFLLPDGSLVETTLSGAHFHVDHSPMDWPETVCGGYHTHTIRLMGMDVRLEGDGWHRHDTQASATALDGTHVHCLEIGEVYLQSLLPQHMALLTGLSNGSVDEVLLGLRSPVSAAVVRHGNTTEIRTEGATVSIDTGGRAAITKGWRHGGQPLAVGKVQTGWVAADVAEFWLMLGKEVQRYELHRTADGWKVHEDDRGPIAARGLPLEITPDEIPELAKAELQEPRVALGDVRRAQALFRSVVLLSAQELEKTEWPTPELESRAKETIHLLTYPRSLWGPDEVLRASEVVMLAMMHGTADPMLLRAHGLDPERVGKPFAGYERFEDCVQDQLERGLSEEDSRKVCGSLQAEVEAEAAPPVEKADPTEDQVVSWLREHYMMARLLPVDKIKKMLALKEQYSYLRPPASATKIYRGLHNVSKSDVERMRDGSHPYTGSRDKSWTTKREVAERFAQGEMTSEPRKPGRYSVVLTADLPHDRALLNADELAEHPGLADEWSELWGERLRVSIAYEGEIVVYGQVGILSVDAEENGEEEVRQFQTLSKAEDERIVYGIVMEPLETDTQGDTQTADTIRAAAHGYLAQYQNIGLQHKTYINEQAQILESEIAKVDYEWQGQKVKAGSWLMAVKVVDDQIWEAVKDGRITGFSIGGRGIRAPLALD